jgi:hypothetical protein
MRYIKLYEDIDFSDIDDYDNVNIGCSILLFGNKGANYIGVVGRYNRVRVFNIPYGFNYKVFEDFNIDNRTVFIGDGLVLDLDKVDIRMLIPGIIIVGYDVSVDDLVNNLSDYYCDDVDGVIKKLNEILKEYLIK